MSFVFNTRRCLYLCVNPQHLRQYLVHKYQVNDEWLTFAVLKYEAHLLGFRGG